MLAPTHFLVGAVGQRYLKRWWLWVPLVLASHGVLDASVIWHDIGTVSSVKWLPLLVIIPVTLWVAWLCIKRRLWAGALLAVVPDLEHFVPGIFHVPGRLHHWIQLYPPWNWHKVYGAWYGILVEAALVMVLIWLVRRQKREMKGD